MEMDLIHYLVWLFEHRGKRLHADGTVSQIDPLQCAALAETGDTADAPRAIDAWHQFRPLPLFKR